MVNALAYIKAVIKARYFEVRYKSDEKCLVSEIISGWENRNVSLSRFLYLDAHFSSCIFFLYLVFFTGFSIRSRWLFSFQVLPFAQDLIQAGDSGRFSDFWLVSSNHKLI